jgi:DnaK suppressor protein
MTATDMQAFRPVLSKLAQQLRGSVAALKEEAFHSSDETPTRNLSDIPVEDSAELGSDGFSEETALSLAENESAQLEEIDAAVERIDEGTFGTCEECDQEIPSARLQMIPFARQCIECARKAQQEEAASPDNL